MAIVTDAIKGYVEQNKSDLIAKTTLGGNSIDRFSLMVGVNGPTTINLLNTQISVQDGSTCGFNPEGDQTISQRTLTPAILKVNMEYCPKDFLNTYASHMVKVGAGKETLPFEAKFIADVIKNLNAYNENKIWTAMSDPEFGNGILAIWDNAGKTRIAKDTTVWKSLIKIYNSASEKLLSHDNLEMYVDPATYRQFNQELVAANLYHYNDNDTQEFIYLPGTGVKVVKVNGLQGEKAAVLTYPENIVIGVDNANDAEDFKFWYSEDNDTYRLKISYALGVQIAFPDEMEIGATM